MSRRRGRGHRTARAIPRTDHTIMHVSPPLLSSELEKQIRIQILVLAGQETQFPETASNRTSIINKNKVNVIDLESYALHGLKFTYMCLYTICRHKWCTGAYSREAKMPSLHLEKKHHWSNIGCWSIIRNIILVLSNLQQLGILIGPEKGFARKIGPRNTCGICTKDRSVEVGRLLGL